MVLPVYVISLTWFCQPFVFSYMVLPTSYSQLHGFANQCFYFDEYIALHFCNRSFNYKDSLSCFVCCLLRLFCSYLFFIEGELQWQCLGANICWN